MYHYTRASPGDKTQGIIHWIWLIFDNQLAFTTIYVYDRGNSLRTHKGLYMKHEMVDQDKTTILAISLPASYRWNLTCLETDHRVSWHARSLHGHL